jgi:hypothetical protein
VVVTFFFSAIEFWPPEEKKARENSLYQTPADMFALLLGVPILAVVHLQQASLPVTGATTASKLIPLVSKHVALELFWKCLRSFLAG